MRVISYLQMNDKINVHMLKSLTQTFALFKEVKGEIFFGKFLTKMVFVYRQYLTYQSQPLPRPTPSVYSFAAIPLVVSLETSMTDPAYSIADCRMLF